MKFSRNEIKRFDLYCNEHKEYTENQQDRHFFKQSSNSNFSEYKRKY